MTYVYVDWRTAAAEQVALLGNQREEISRRGAKTPRKAG
jgi:hypothetical protein